MFFSSRFAGVFSIAGMRRRIALAVPLAAPVAIAFVLAGCATVPTDPVERAAYEETNDPLEPLNRGVFEVNQVVDGLIIKPLALMYRGIVPEVVRTHIHQILENMGEPLIVVNNLLQGEFDRAGTTAARFGVNTTVGLGGIFEVAQEWGLPKQNGDFGQTLYSWGLPEGPYLVLPLLGPSNPRDVVGTVVDSYIDPMGYLRQWGALNREDDARIGVGRTIVGGLDKRAEFLDTLDEIEKTSLDYYAQLRSLFRQDRATKLRHGESAEPITNDSLYADPAKPKP